MVAQVGRLGAGDAAALAAAGVELLPGGNVSLVPRAGEEVAAAAADGRVIATRRADDAPVLVDAAPAAPSVRVVDDVTPPAPPPPQLPAAAPVVDVPPGPEPGDVLRVATAVGVVHVRVPPDVAAGARLRLEGLVEVAVPPGAAAGEVVGVALPDDSVVAVELRPEDVDGALAVAFPVSVLD